MSDHLTRLGIEDAHGSVLTAQASTLHRGERLVMVQGEVRDRNGRAVAHAAATFAVVAR